jgi:hypothetical protein
MIGGVDTALVGPVLGGDLDVLLRAARAVWPLAIVESDDGTVVKKIGEALRLRWDAPCEFFIYENRAAYESWSAHGLTDGSANKIVTVMVEPDCISFVVGDDDGPTASIVRETVDALTKNRWFALAAA